MSMAINRISASGVAAMLYPVMKPSRVPKVAPDSKTAASAADQSAVQAAPQPADTSRTPDQVHAAFENARAALGSVTTGTTSAEPSTGVQSGGLQQGRAYARGEQQAGQVLDFTA